MHCRRPAVLIVASCLVASICLGQAAEPGSSDKERLEAAKAEQQKKEQEANASEKAAAATEEEEAERQRLEAMGATEKDLPPEEQPGFFVVLDAGYMEFSDADRTVARHSDILTAATTAEELDADPAGGDGLPDAYTSANTRDLTLTYDAEFAPQFELGFRRKAGGAFSVRYWTWSGSSSVSGAGSQRYPGDAAVGDLILGAIDNQGMAATSANALAYPDAFVRPFGSPRQITTQQLHGADSVEASSSLDASRLDLLYSRTPLVRPRLDVSFRLGFTYLEVERKEAATFNWRSFPRGNVFAESLSVEEVSASCKNAGYGITVGIASRFALSASRRFNLRGGLELAGLSSQQELAFRDAQTFSQPGLPDQPPDVYQDVTDDSAGKITSIIQADVAFECRVGKRARLGLGYRAEWWFDALTEQHFPNAVNTAALVDESVDLSLGGPYLRVGFFF